MRYSLLSAVVVISLLNSGCASQNRVGMTGLPTSQQNAGFMQGGIKLSSLSKTEITVMDYSNNEMIAAISITNDKTQPLTFSEQNLSAQHVSSNNEIGTAKIYSYEELQEEYNDSTGSALGQIGTTAAIIGSSFVPFGNIAMSLGYLTYSLYQQNDEHKKRMDSLLTTQLTQMYLRKNSVAPKQEYSGIVKLGFSEELKKGDKVLFNVILDNKTENFTFVCQ